jgi:hypothetical protein
MVDPDRPLAWQDPVPTSMILSLVNGGFSVIVTKNGKDRYYILASGHTIEQVNEKIILFWKSKMVVNDGST